MSEECLRIEGNKVYSGVVRPEWIDINQHMNVAYYVLAFDRGIDALWSRFGITDDYIRTEQHSTFAVESHVSWQRELTVDAPYVVTSQILAYDQKRIHQFMRLYHGGQGYLAATAEWMNLHVNLKNRRVTPWPGHVFRNIETFARTQQSTARPEQAGQRMRVVQPYWTIEDYHC